MDRKWLVWGVIGAAIAAVGILAFRQKAEAAPAAHTATWQLMPPAEVFQLQAGMIYGISDTTNNVPVSADQIRKDFTTAGFRVLDVTQEKPQGWPASDGDGRAYLIFTPETDKTMPASVLGATGHIFVLA